MAAYRMRPRFELVLSIPPDAAIAQVKTHLARQQGEIEGAFRQNHVQLSISLKNRHFWSPFTSLEFTPASQDPNGSQVHGIIGPSPNVWTMFMAGYFALYFLMFVALVMGYSQWSIERTPWGFYLIPILGLFLLLWYGFSALGQRLAAGQIQILRQFLDDSLASHILQEEDI